MDKAHCFTSFMAVLKYLSRKLLPDHHLTVNSLGLWTILSTLVFLFDLSSYFFFFLYVIVY
jgi:hypothetical protein